MLNECQESGFSHDIPTTLHRSKADCPVPEVFFLLKILVLIQFSSVVRLTLVFKLLFVVQEMVTVSVDGSVLDRIAKIMSYLRLGSSGKVLKKKKKDAKGLCFAYFLAKLASVVTTSMLNTT